mmetsp:Transcript_44360/g.96243  ORF Transcript_44360/g.96243 Transcript_44360/m.96243 type:complete len:173 (+) Transcript_44360:526-1044(+)
MSYGPGASLQLWDAYFPSKTLHFVEHDMQCSIAQRQNVTGAIYIGDQTDITFLNLVARSAMTNHKGFDIIIDDGAHSMEAQMTSLEILWKTVRPNGVYIIEDLHTSYQNHYGGGPRGSRNTAMEFIRSLTDDVHCPESGAAICADSGGVDFVRSVQCWNHICAIEKQDHTDL